LQVADYTYLKKVFPRSPHTLSACEKIAQQGSRVKALFSLD
jgi:hypothetical protein